MTERSRLDFDADTVRALRQRTLMNLQPLELARSVDPLAPEVAKDLHGLYSGNNPVLAEQFSLARLVQEHIRINRDPEAAVRTLRVLSEIAIRTS